MLVSISVLLENQVIDRIISPLKKPWFHSILVDRATACVVLDEFWTHMSAWNLFLDFNTCFSVQKLHLWLVEADGAN